MEFNSYSNACDYIENIGVGNIVQVGMIIGISPWPGADKINYDYFIITKITIKFVMFKELNISKKYSGDEYGGYKPVLFRLYKQRADKIKKQRVYNEKPKTKISIDKLSTHNLVIEKQNKKYGFISLTETYGGTVDWGC
jgi:hypothetical protein